MITAVSNRKTKQAIIIAAILKEPFICIYALLPFFLLKDLGAISLQIVIYTMLRPVSSIFSFYLSELISRNAVTLKNALLWTGILARLSFIPALLTDSVSLYILGSTLFMIFSRAEIPAWMEIIKKNVYKDNWEKSFSLGSIISYSSGVLLTVFFATFMDSGPLAWKYIFAVSLLMGAIAICFQAFLVDNDQVVATTSKKIKKSIAAPIKDAILLMSKKREFRSFQIAFMIGGLGLMIIQPVIPIYFTSILSIKKSDMMVAFCICKALGFVLTTPLWNTMIKKVEPATFIVFVLFGFALFSFFLIFSSISLSLIFMAYLIYGIAQAGSHLIWHLSGPMFSGEESSARYSGVNIVMVGIRGLIGPVFGGMLLLFLHPIYIFSLSMILCMSGGIFYLRSVQVEKPLDVNTL
jgi:MFS family permease